MPSMNSCKLTLGRPDLMTSQTTTQTPTGFCFYEVLSQYIGILAIFNPEAGQYWHIDGRVFFLRDFQPSLENAKASSTYLGLHSACSPGVLQRALGWEREVSRDGGGAGACCGSGKTGCPPASALPQEHK